MRIRQVDFPAEILEAQSAGTLVVFAGAGVSMDSPSNYPDFNALAASIGGAVYPRLEGEVFDRYLGRLTGIGVAVHDQVRSILTSPDSHPNAVHEALIGVFREPQRVRIVTTNFDRHFTTVAMNRFGTGYPEVYCAPALPVGTDFTGIVHLHGSVDKSSNRMVLTDADFGRAYITEGWATQFLQGVFSRYVVLFVGYSHQDMLLNYLARGFTAGSKGPGRFALTTSDEDERWRNLGVTPVHYPLTAAPQKHSELGIALSAWSEQSNAGALANEERIKSIVEKGVPLDGEDRDYIEHSLSDVSTLRFFARHAITAEWMLWIENRPQFERLFAWLGTYGEGDSVLAYWFAKNFALKHPDDALNLVRRKGVVLSSVIWTAIAHVLFQEKQAGTVLRKWVPVLLLTAPRKQRNDLLDMILSERCVFPGDELPALLLLEYLTKPTLGLEESFRSSDDDRAGKVSADITIVGSAHWLERSWASYFKPNLGHFATRLAPIVTSHLAMIYDLLKSFEAANENWHPISYSRGMIESRQQDHLHSGVSLLLDMAAALVSWACDNDRILADALIAQWSAAEDPLEKRLAIFGVSVAPWISGDEKLRWLLHKNLLFRTGIKHEVFLLLQAAYAQASSKARVELLNRITVGPEWKSEHPDIAEYETFNLLIWLARACPSCELIGKLLAEMEGRHPDYGKREHPDMDSWIGPVRTGAYPTPTDWEELRSYDLDRLLTRFKEGQSAREIGWRVIECARNSISWSIDIGRDAQSRSEWHEEIWNALTTAWASVDLSEDAWKSVLKILKDSQPVHPLVASNVISLLNKGIQSTTAGIPLSLIPDAKLLGDQIWPFCEQMERNGDELPKDWLSAAVNHPAGRLTEFYLQALSKVRQTSTTDAGSIKDYQTIFEVALHGSSYGDALARVILASQVHYLFALDEDWTVHSVFPLFDTRLDASRAKQCWHGYLYWGRWTNAMLDHLLPDYEGRFSLLRDEPEEIVHSFCDHLAGIASYSLVNPLEHGWLLRFLTTAEPKAHVTWADQMRHIVQSLDDEAKVNLWNRWLKRYWEGRLHGMPLPLSAEEAAEMFEWVMALGPAYPEAVNLLKTGTYPQLGHSMVYCDIAKSEMLKLYPEATADLLLFLAEGEKGRQFYDLNELRNAVEQIITLVPGYTALRRLCDELARLGDIGVSDLVKRLG